MLHDVLSCLAKQSRFDHTTSTHVAPRGSLMMVVCRLWINAASRVESGQSNRKMPSRNLESFGSLLTRVARRT